MPAPRIGTPVASFGVSYSIVAIGVALADALTVLIPGLEERAEQTLGPAWLYMGVLGMIVFGAAGLFGLGRGQSRRKTAILVIGGTVLGGIIIAGAAAYAGLSGSM